MGSTKLLWYGSAYYTTSEVPPPKSGLIPWPFSTPIKLLLAFNPYKILSLKLTLGDALSGLLYNILPLADVTCTLLVFVVGLSLWPCI